MRGYLRTLRTGVPRLLLVAAVTIISSSCGDDQDPTPTDGTILVGTQTSGFDFDPNGYLVSVNGGQGLPIGNQETIYVEALEPGNYQVSLNGIAGNCAVPADANPQEITVEPGDTADVLFDITCEASTPPDGGEPVP